MNLRDYLNTAERGTAAEIARAVGVHPVMVSQWGSGDKPVPVLRCPLIEAATGRQVMRWDLRPADWWVFWPELMHAPGHPPIPEPPHTQPAALAADEARDAA
jgi:DNA-binding transcriptional regulator YdaS (Cro superfamily)